MLIIGVILLIIAAICFFVARSSEGRLHAMNAADTYTAAMLSQVHQRVTSSLGGDALAEPCEVEGIIECDSPLKAPLSGTACVAYDYNVNREYQQQVTTKDQQGKQETRVERRSETVETDRKHVRFWVRDDSGRSLVDPEGAEIDFVETANRWEDAPATPMVNRTLGVRRTERALPVGTRVYVLGCAMDSQGQAIVSCGPSQKKLKFLISRKSEQELASSAASSAKNFRYAAIGCGALGALLVLLGAVMG